MSKLQESVLKANIARKVVVPLIGSLVVLCCIISLTLAFTYDAILKEQLKERSIELAESFVIASETEVTQANLIRVTNSMGSFHDVNLVVLLEDSTAKIIASNRNKYTNTLIENTSDLELRDKLAHAITPEVTKELHKFGDFYQSEYKFSLFFDPNLPPQKLTLFLLIDPKSEQRKVTDFMLILVVGLFIGMLLVGVGLYLSISKIVLKPIKLLVSAVSLSVPVPRSAKESFDPKDELGRLASAYDSLMHRLASEHQTLLEEKKKSEAAVLAKNEFLAVMTHEIRTPLNGIIGCSELLNATKLDSEQQQYLTLIKHSGEQLLTLVNDILDLSKIEASKLKLELRPVDIIGLCEEVVSLFQFRTQDKDIHFSFKNHTQNVLNVGIDSTRLKQVLINLVDNAFKFTEEGEVRLELSGQVIDSNNVRLKVEVIDTGIGLSQHQIVNVFDKFSQADSSTTRKYGGTGLGLSITSQLIELMGGRLQVESLVGQGSRFYFEFTVANYNQGLEVVTDQPLMNQSFDREFSMLIVDDIQLNTLVASKMLRHDKLEIDIALSGMEALNKCRETFYDVIIMDCLMPSMDGYETTRQIRKMQSSRQSYIFALTASALKETEQRCYDAGMNKFLAKPLTKNGAQLIHDYLRGIKKRAS
ncbi:ATP-binding protein [Vibrio makurazakiensis]|uniref:ATP-binding protein n=1 Tax=Vibrio makurazakiensis TaxID=2910250 RepID=UPI003D12850B